MNRVLDLFGRTSSDPIKVKNLDAVIDQLHLSSLKKIQLASSKYSFIYLDKKYFIEPQGNKSYSISDGKNEVVITPLSSSDNLAEAIASHLVKYNDNLYKVTENNHPGFESTNLYYFDIKNLDPTNLLNLIYYLNKTDNKLYRSFKMSYNNFLKLSVTPDNIKFENPKIITSLEVNITALIQRLNDEDKSEVRRLSEFINGVFLDNRSQYVYELLKDKKPIDKISVLVEDNGLRMIEGTARLAVLYALGYEMIEALIYGDVRSLINS